MNLSITMPQHKEQLFLDYLKFKGWADAFKFRRVDERGGRIDTVTYRRLFSAVLLCLLAIPVSGYAYDSADGYTSQYEQPYGYTAPSVEAPVPQAIRPSETTVNGQHVQAPEYQRTYPQDSGPRFSQQGGFDNGSGGQLPVYRGGYQGGYQGSQHGTR